jgi:predicted nuclease with TOPRIM domain
VTRGGGKRVMRGGRVAESGALAALALSFLGGCADQCSRDPSQVGLGCATVNLATGVYEADDAEIRREIAALDARRSELEDEAARLATEAQRLSGERRASAERLAALNRETAALNRRLADASNRERADQRRLSELRAREAELSRGVLRVSADETGADPRDIARLTAERDALRREIDGVLAATS